MAVGAMSGGRELEPSSAPQPIASASRPVDLSRGGATPATPDLPPASDRVSEREVRRTLDRLRSELLQQRTGDGHWEGRLSASALSTATAVSAMSAAWLAGGLPSTRRDQLVRSIDAGTAWLIAQQNDDGGFGDTDRSHSNIATSYLALAALRLSEKVSGSPVWPQSDDDRLLEWIDGHGGLEGLRARYGKDKTFVVPILTNLAIAGCVPWDQVPGLPFEAAVLPQSCYRFVGMPVVSYAIPALVAIGQVKFFHSGAPPIIRNIRRASVAPTMKVLRHMQPASGGYLEATPLTAFVAMSLAASGRAEEEVTVEALRFLQESMRADGSWPIDTNLATWTTSLATLALASDPADEVPEAVSWRSEPLAKWMLDCQHQGVHPFTGARPGGWGWTDLSGAVPDADDTPAAILSLSNQRDGVPEPIREAIDNACFQGIDWLLKLQNRDGGWPTFCRGWGKLPFDRSSTDLTAHALRAIRTASARQHVAGRSGPRGATSASSRRFQAKWRAARQAGLRFLRKQQNGDGSWAPLWFGNQDRRDEDNPVYGTARVLLDADPGLGDDAIRRGVLYLIGLQNTDGGWGGGPSVRRHFDAGDGASTVEETSLALETLASLWHPPGSAAGTVLIVPPNVRAAVDSAILSGAAWLVRAVGRGQHKTAWPIGFYFAKLWYYEQLYPLIFATAALGRVLQCGVLRSPEPVVSCRPGHADPAPPRDG